MAGGVHAWVRQVHEGLARRPDVAALLRVLVACAVGFVVIRVVLGELLHNRLGQSQLHVVTYYLTPTASILLAALVVAIVGGLLGGIVAALSPGWLRPVLRAVGLVLRSLPVFVAALFLQYLAGIKFKVWDLPVYFPVTGWSPPRYFWDWLWKMALPGMVIGCAAAVQVADGISRRLRESSSSGVGVPGGDRWARIGRVVRRAPAALVPALADVLAPVFVVAAGAVFVVEQVFALPGLGQLFPVILNNRWNGTGFALAVLVLTIVAGLVIRVIARGLSVVGARRVTSAPPAAQPDVTTKAVGPMPVSARVALGWLAIVVAGTALADVLPLHSFKRVARDAAARSGPSFSHPLGTDGIGRDELARIVFGGRPFISLGLRAILIGLVLGVVLGWVLGARRDRLGRWTCTVVEVMSCVPAVLAIFAFMIIFGTYYWSTPRFMSFVLGVLFAPQFFRAGVSVARSGVRSMPFFLRSLVVPIASSFSSTVVALTTLSFLGWGTFSPRVDWGVMARDGRQSGTPFGRLVIVPVVVITLTVLACTVIAEHASRAERRQVVST